MMDDVGMGEVPSSLGFLESDPEDALNGRESTPWIHVASAGGGHDTEAIEWSDTEELDTEEPTGASTELPVRQPGSLVVDIPESTLVSPVSHYEPFDPGVPIVSERTAIRNLVQVAKSVSEFGGDFMELELDEFAVYSENQHNGVEMRPLHQLDTRANSGKFFFDGVLSAGQRRLFVRRVPILALPIGNYGDLEECTVREQLWILSAFNEQRDVYYRLGKPAKEYARFFRPFLWVADLSKHFVDYIKSMWEDGLRVSIHHFRTHFGKWIRNIHGGSSLFRRWLEEHPSQDFRTSIVANLPFLHKEAVGVLGERPTYVHIIWEEASAFKRFKEPHKETCHDKNPPTIVTPYIMKCFEHLPFGDQLKVVPFSSSTQKLRDNVIRMRRLKLPHDTHQAVKLLSNAKQNRIENITPGDTISTHRDAVNSGTKWEREQAKDFNDVDRWFALVQKVHFNHSTGKRSFDVAWYYRPVDTLCGLMKYPWDNELFLSDHCSCNEATKIEEDEVLGVHHVDFHGTATRTTELFCHQTYIHEERKWITLKTSHLVCEHLRGTECRPEFTPGDTVLVRLDKTNDISEPCEVVSFFRKGDRKLYTFRMRRLLRRRRVDPFTRRAPPNELVYSRTGALVDVSESDILDRCQVRFLKHKEPVPTPYDRDGVGGLFFITHEQRADESIVPLEESPSSLRQGFDPGDEHPRLRGLDLFCGGGNFGRGLEEGCGINMKWANDYDAKAVHTYMANVHPGQDMHPFMGSIDILQRLAIEGKFSDSVPAVGKVDFISAGSPCPGFSRLTNDKTTVKQRKNQSLVASFASFVDLYRPKYGILENVPGIVENKSRRKQDVFSQLICAIVGLGYQTQFYFLDASSCGSPQRRSRVFVAFAAPGCEPPKQPLQTHSHPPNTPWSGVGKLPNGEAMARRRIPVATPFKFVTGEAATADLPPIQDSKPDICVSHPDHRVSVGTTKKLRTAICHIPTRPFGMNFAKAWFGQASRPLEGSGVLTKAGREFFPQRTSGSISRVAPRSRAYGRQYPNRLIETVTTRLSPYDSKIGRQIHWREPRTMSVMEARRAQGFRDHEVLLGNPADQLKIVGNSVAREISVALGIEFREAWAATLERDRTIDEAVPAIVRQTLNTAPKKTMAEKEPLVVEEPSDSGDGDRYNALRSIKRGSSGVKPIRSRSTTTRQSWAAKKITDKRPADIWSVDYRPSKVPKSSPVAGCWKRSPGSALTTVATMATTTTIQTIKSPTVQPSPLGKHVIVLDDDEP